MNVKELLQSLSLNDSKSVEEAIRVVSQNIAEIRDREPDRFEGVEVSNLTRSTRFIFGLFQGLDQGSVLAPGCVRDTGLIVCGVDLPPGGHVFCTVDSSIKCQATRIKYSALVRHSDGQEETITWQDAVSSDPETLFLPSAHFTLDNLRNRDGLEAFLSPKVAEKNL